MGSLSQAALDVREVGESVALISEDIQLLLPQDTTGLEKVQHAKRLVESVVSLITLLSAVDYKSWHKEDELSNEVRKIEFSCFGLQTLLSRVQNDIDLFKRFHKIVRKFINTIHTAGNRIITISLIADDLQEPKSQSYSNDKEIGGDVDGNFKGTDSKQCQRREEDYGELLTCGNQNTDHGFCYTNKAACELDCDGVCYRDDTVQYKNTQKCPEPVETFTESELTHVENGYDKHLDSATEGTIEHTNNILDLLVTTYNPETEMLVQNDYEVTNYKKLDNIAGGERRHELTLDNDAAEPSYYYDNQTTAKSTSAYETTVVTFDTTSAYDTYTTIESAQTSQTTTNTDETAYPYDTSNTPASTPGYTTTTDTAETTYYSDTYSTTESTPACETTTETSESKYSDDTYNTIELTPSYETTAETTYPSDIYTTTESTPGYDTTTDTVETTYSYDTHATTESAPVETTTEDLYKVSQDIYSAAQDLSTKANEISSLNSDISSKISNINSMVSDLNTYENDELSKKVQTVSKITQEMSSRTSEISSLCSTTSSLASDVSSCSNDMPSADRRHRFKTSPWQKMSAKCQEIVTACQGIVTAAQDVLLKLETLVTTTKELSVAESVSANAYDVTAKTQLVISETLNIVSATIELMNVIDS